MRLGWNYEAGGGGNVVSSIESEEGLEGAVFQTESRATYGFKWRATDQSGWLPESNLLVQAFTPTTSDTTATEAAITYVWGWELPERWKLDAAMRYATAGEKDDDFAIWNPSTVLRVALASSKTGDGDRMIGGYPTGMFPYCILVDSEGRVAGHGSLGPELLAKLRALPAEKQIRDPE